MKIRALTRSLDTHAPARKGDAAPTSRNLDPALHPFDKPREYTRAVNAAKLERMHARPFVGALEGHSDGVYSLALDARRLGVVASGAGDGEVRIWDLASQACIVAYPRAHNGIVSSLVVSPLSFAAAGYSADANETTSSRLAGRRLLSAGTDRVVRMWDADPKRERFGGAEQDMDEDITGSGNIRSAASYDSKKAEVSAQQCNAAKAGCAY